MTAHGVAIEALSTIIGCEVTSIQVYKRKNPGKQVPDCISPQEFLTTTVNSSFFPRLLGNSNLLAIASNVQGTGEAAREELFINEDDFFDPQYDRDFTDETDRRMFRRGNEPYRMPCGWNRIALKVLDKYPDGNGWLGMGRDAWPVSYHGTSMDGAKGIIEGHYEAGDRARFGRGVYSTPNLRMADKRYSKEFTSKITGKSYKVVLQNRINPEKRKIFHSGNYWLVPVPEGTSAQQEKSIVESSIRPYGLLLREVEGTAV